MTAQSISVVEESKMSLVWEKFVWTKYIIDNCRISLQYNSHNFETEETCGCLEQKETDYQMYRKAKYFLITVRVKEEKHKLPPKEFSSLNQ